MNNVLKECMERIASKFADVYSVPVTDWMENVTAQSVGRSVHIAIGQLCMSSSIVQAIFRDLIRQNFQT